MHTPPVRPYSLVPRTPLRLHTEGHTDILTVFVNGASIMYGTLLRTSKGLVKSRRVNGSLHMTSDGSPPHAAENQLSFREIGRAKGWKSYY